MILSPEVLTIIIINLIFLVFGTIAFILSLRIFFKWNMMRGTGAILTALYVSYLVMLLV